MTIYVLIRIQETYEVKLETKIPQNPKEGKIPRQQGLIRWH